MRDLIISLGAFSPKKNQNKARAFEKRANALGRNCLLVFFCDEITLFPNMQPEEHNRKDDQQHLTHSRASKQTHNIS